MAQQLSWPLATCKQQAREKKEEAQALQGQQMDIGFAHTVCIIRLVALVIAVASIATHTKRKLLNVSTFYLTTITVHLFVNHKQYSRTTKLF